MLFLTRLFLVIVLFMGVVELRAQEMPSTEQQVLLAAGRHVAQGLDVDGAITVDPRFAARAHGSQAGTFVEDMPAPFAEELATVLGATVRRQDEVFVCTSSLPSSCSLRDASAFIKLTHAIVDGNTAVLWVDVLRPSESARSPVWTVQRELRLSQRGNEWVVVSDREVAIS